MARHNGPDGVYLVIDTKDPHTPALVYDAHDNNATYDCAVGTGCLTGYDGDVELSEAALRWLANYGTLVEAAYDMARPDGWEG